MKYYAGYRNAGNLVVKKVEDGEERFLFPRRDLFDHSPGCFECGYGGTGPAALALALLADFFGDNERALRLHQGFKNEVVSSLSRHGWTLTSSQIEEAVEKIERPRSIQSMLTDIVAAKAAVKMLENRLDAGGDWLNDWDNAWRPEIQAIQECLERMKKELE